jgi:hypothetical protein
MINLATIKKPANAPACFYILLLLLFTWAGAVLDQRGLMPEMTPMEALYIDPE